jgi:hypothetical protein
MVFLKTNMEPRREEKQIDESRCTDSLPKGGEEQQTTADNLPVEFLCPLTNEIMKDPVSLGTTGLIFERVTIEKWLANNHNHPLTNIPLEAHDLVLSPNLELQLRIKDYFGKMRDLQSQVPENASDIQVPPIQDFDWLNLVSMESRRLERSDSFAQAYHGLMDRWGILTVAPVRIPSHEDSEPPLLEIDNHPDSDSLLLNRVHVVSSSDEDTLQNGEDTL